MYKNIISLFFIIFFLIGCEKKDVFANVIKKLKEQNQTTTKTKVLVSITKTTIKKTEIPLKKVPVKQEKKIEQNITKEPPKEILVNKDEADIKPKKKITNLTLKTANGKKIHLTFKDDGINFKEYKNKVIILDIFTTWCPPCLESIPHLNQIQKQYKKDLQIIGILMEEDKKNQQVKDFKKIHHINYPITNSKENFTLVDTWGGVSGYPTIIIFDKNGTYFNHFNGSPPIEMLESDIKKALRKK